MLLEGRVVLVTGAGQGMGQGIARAILEEGGRVAVTDVRLEGVQRLADVLARECGTDEGILALALDVTDAEGPGHAMEQAQQTFGSVDGLVNNAGVIAMEGALRTPLERWTWHFDVNSAGLFRCCQAFASLLGEQARAGSFAGSIVNIASNAGKVGYPNMAAYNASKAAVISLTRSLAMEWSDQGINVNAVCPGSVDTPMLRGVAEWIGARTGDDPDQLLAGMVPRQMGRHIQPIEVGRVVAFLLSERAQIIRGQSISVDGGETPY